MSDAVEAQVPIEKAELARPQALQRQEVTPNQMLAIALEKGADMGQLEKLMDMQERWEKNQARKAFVEAKAGFKSEAPAISKNRRVVYEGQKGVTDYRHASLDHILDTICPVMSRHGLSHSWSTTQGDKGMISVTCRLEHMLGHYEETTLFASPDPSGGKNSVQAIGSTVSYLQRYTFLAITGLATGDMDDDGSGGPDAGHPPHPAQAQSQNQSAGRSLPPYPDKRFSEKLPEWQGLIRSGAKSADHIVAMLSKRASLTEQQIKAIKGE